MLTSLTTVLLQLRLSPLIKKGFNCFGLICMLSFFDRLSQPSVDFYVFIVCTGLGIQKAAVYAMHKTPLQYFSCFKDHLLYREKQQFPPVGETW